ncbi:MAG: Spy/CpxP family protein refolding chaperone [Deltaproteobacteria bacterium]|nr:Spy/CpxP family protein refolding chaperone [Deltaproteobacteria bacterium]
MKKRLITLGGIALVITALTLPAFARGPGWGGGPRAQGGREGGPGINCPYYGWGYSQNLTDEQKGQLDNLHRKFSDDTAQLRNQIWTKQGELRTLLSSPNPDPAKAKAFQKELSDLKAKMAQERLTRQMEELKINPDARFGGRGYGSKGYGRGMSGRGGYGPGSCWN